MNISHSPCRSWWNKAFQTNLNTVEEHVTFQLIWKHETLSLSPCCFQVEGFAFSCHSDRDHSSYLKKTFCHDLVTVTWMLDSSLEMCIFLLKDPVHQFSLKPQRKSPNNDGVSCELNRDGRLFLGRGVAVDFSLNYSFRCREQHWWDSICLHGWLKPRPDEN